MLEDFSAAELEDGVAAALQLAVSVGRALSELRPAVTVPKAIRPFVKFAKLPPSARPAVLRVLEEDEAFRAQVAAAGRDLGVGEAAALFLDRPEGWQAELATLLRAARTEQEAVEVERTDRVLRRRLDGAEQAIARLEESAVAARAATERAVEELATERRSRQEAERAAGRSREALAAVERARAQAEAELRRMRAELEAARAEVVSARGEVARAVAGAGVTVQGGSSVAARGGSAVPGRSPVAGEAARGGSAVRGATVGAATAGAATGGVEAAPGGAAARADPAAAGPMAPGGRAVGDGASVAGALPVGGRAPGAAMPAGAVPAAAGPEAHAAAPSTNPVVAAAIRDAARAAAELARSLAAAAGALDGPPAPAEVLPPPRGRTGRGGGRPRRLPHPLPPAIFDDSAEAAAHLMRVGRMLVLVDGYNVTLSTWQDLPISSQRHRLIDACRELAARSGVEVLVVFDGAEEPGDLPPPVGRAGVRWRFSPPDVEADDVLLALVSDLELDRPVTVASSDRRVRDGARALGANAISTAQLLSVLRRDGRTRSG